MAERFREQVNYRPIQTETGAASGMLSLAQKLEGFKNFAYQKASQIGQDRAIERGVTRAGQVQLEKDETGLTKSPQFEEKKFIGGVEVQAYNKALRNAYLASLDNDNREALNTIANENIDDVIGFNDKVESYKNSVLKGVDPSVRQIVTVDIERKISDYRQKIQTNNIKKNIEVAKLQHESNIKSATDESLRASRNADSILSMEARLKAYETLDSGVETGFWTKEQADIKKTEIARRVIEQQYLGEVDRIAETSIQAANDKISELEHEVPPGFPPDEWRNMVIEAQQNVNRKASRVRQDIRKLEKEIEFDESVSRGMGFLDPAVPADPAKGSQDRKDINNAYTQFMQTWSEDVPVSEIWKQAQAFVEKLGIMPDKLIGTIGAVSRSGTPDQVYAYSKMVEELGQKNPTVLKDLSPESRAITKQVSDSVNSGVELETAIEIARKNVYGLTDTEKEAVRLKAKTIDLESSLKEDLDKFYDPSIIPFMGEEPEPTPALQAEYNINFERFMVHTNGNVEQSRSLAAEAMLKTWGTWENQMMKWAPSVYYSRQGVPDDWMHDQFEDDIKDFVASENLNIDKGDIQIVADKGTRESLNPTWALVATSGGQLVPIGRWSPDFTKTKEYTRARQTPFVEREIGRRKRLELQQLKSIYDIKVKGIGDAGNKKPVN